MNNNQSILKIFRDLKYVIIKRHVYGLTSMMRVLPDFFVIGVVRGGTTSMYHYLDQHPSIVKSAYDELGFFDDNFKLGQWIGVQRSRRRISRVLRWGPCCR